MKKFLLAAVLAMLALPAQAKDWQVDYAHSRLGFTGDQSGAKFDGAFKKFTAQISFDPAHPEAGNISVTVDTASAVTGDSDRDSYLPQDAWFKTRMFPAATFTATKFRRTGDNAYEAAGALTLKGITRDLAVPFTLTPEGDHWRAQGHVVLMRNDFSIGEGSFASEAYVRHAVDVSFDLAAKPRP